jgi:hypothetical protein
MKKGSGQGQTERVGENRKVKIEEGDTYMWSYRQEDNKRRVKNLSEVAMENTVLYYCSSGT